MDHSLNILTLITNASLVVKGVMALLLIMSIVGWVLIFQLIGRLSQTIKEDDNFQKWFWQGKPLSALHSGIISPEPQDLAYLFYIAYLHYQSLQQKQIKKDERLNSTERNLQINLSKAQVGLEKGLSTLASIGSIAPYIGLFGTVWGIMSAFIGISSAQSVSLATVAPGIAEALIATAIGLFTAIPASYAYNHFTAKANKIYETRALFCQEIIATIEKHELKKNAKKDGL